MLDSEVLSLALVLLEDVFKGGGTAILRKWPVKPRLAWNSMCS